MTSDDVAFTILLTEVLVPVTAATAFSDALHDWCDGVGINEVVVLSGVPIKHAPDDHRTFFVATDGYRSHRLAGTDLPAMGTGYLDGTRGSLLAAGIDTTRQVCVYVNAWN